MADDKNGTAAVYVGWTTFKNAVEALAQGVPNVVDRSAFAGQSWGVQSQLLAGFKFLGLIEDDGKPTATLHTLAVTDEAARKKKLEAIIREKYVDLFALDLMKTTPEQLDRQIGESYNVSGDTREKAVRFFLSAVDYLGIPISRLFKRPGASGGGAPVAPRRRRAATPRSRVAAEPEEIPEAPQPQGGTARTVNLKSGGTLTVSATMDVFKLSAEDRVFVFSLIDSLEKYESTNATQDEPRPKRTPVTE